MLLSNINLPSISFLQCKCTAQHALLPGSGACGHLLPCGTPMGPAHLLCFPYFLLLSHYVWSQCSSQAQVKAKRQCPLHAFRTPPGLYRSHHPYHVFPHALLSPATPLLTPSLCLQTSPSPFQVPQAMPKTTYPTFM